METPSLSHGRESDKLLHAEETVHPTAGTTSENCSNEGLRKAVMTILCTRLCDLISSNVGPYMLASFRKRDCAGVIARSRIYAVASQIEIWMFSVAVLHYSLPGNKADEEGFQSFVGLACQEVLFAVSIDIVAVTVLGA